MECYHKIQLKSGDVVPCGKCPSCLANQRQEWVFRLQQEYLTSHLSLFVTITYNDENLPSNMSVNKKDIQLFHKRLRKHFPVGSLRFYLVSEYGDHTYRPHYHGLYFFTQNFDLNFIYDVFNSSWNKGFLKFGNVELASIVYCTKYCLKKSEFPEGRVKPFRLMSKMNGGLGFGYLKKMSDFHIESENLIFSYADGKKCRMPKYYKDKLKPFVISDEYSFNTNLKRVHDTFLHGYKEFIKDKHFVSLQASLDAYNEFIRSRSSNQDMLVLKHTKKQNNF